MSTIYALLSDYLNEDVCDIAVGYYVNRSDVSWEKRAFAATVPSTTSTLLDVKFPLSSDSVCSWSRTLFEVVLGGEMLLFGIEFIDLITEIMLR